MQGSDIPFAIKLSNQEKWGTTRIDFERLLNLSPRGCFIAYHGRRKVGLTTTTRYGKRLAWIGNVVVDKDFRGKNVGHQLVEHAIAYLQKLRVEHIGLYCFKRNVSFYEDLGFAEDTQFLRLHRKPKRITFRTVPPDLGPAISLKRLLWADRRAFGADRSRLIRLVLSTGAGWHVGSAQNSTGISYLLVKDYHDMYEYGPWVNIRTRRDLPTKILLQILAKTQSKPIEVTCLRDNAQAVTLFKAHDFRVMEEGYRMYFGRKAHIAEDRAQYALGFLDKG